ncbi:putative kinase [Paenibacillus taihuensis]|uniref:Putative kinase n=1 Tax=Paenibacillus taihuensis TaxID=1156355 RepID=A0A3D9S1C2_9BACL|nr:ATP-binding protein [Paenibacillus taihuensis]REE86111.1 putative kinase [Paenibacillus taihuensis]
MTRLVVVTVGKTHSGKSTFARALEEQLQDSVVVDQDNHAGFINAYYTKLRPMNGPNQLKYAITQTIVEYAIHQTDLHLILCNSNRDRDGRLRLLKHFQQEGFTTVLVEFDLPAQILEERVANSERSKNIFRFASSFEDVLRRQQADPNKDAMNKPLADEADYLFVIRDAHDVQTVIQRILDIPNLLSAEFT